MSNGKNNVPPNASPSDSSKYSHEAKIVAAVWVHEKTYNNQTWDDIKTNFRIRFNMPPPKNSTLQSWEKKLFETGVVEQEKCGRPISRRIHMPFVKQSLDEAPHLSMRERAKELGLSSSTLLKILKEDLNMEFELEDDGSEEKKGKWKAKKGEN